MYRNNITITDIINEIIAIDPNYEKYRSSLYTLYKKSDLQRILDELKEERDVRK